MAETVARRTFPLHLRPLDEREQLFTDIRRHNLLGLNQLLERGPDLNVPHAEHGYPLIYATRIGFLDTLEALLAYRADPNVNQNGTALHCAVAAARPELADFLLANGCDASIANDAGETPLFLAIRAGDAAAAAKLAPRTPLDAVNADGDSPLALAVMRSSQELVKLLLASGADPNPAGRHPLQAARDLGLAHIVNLLRLHGAREAVRRPHSSKQQLRTRNGRIGDISAREDLLAAQDPGSCYLCGQTENLIRLLPCGHAVICPACAALFCDRFTQCPTCRLNFFATTK